MLSQSGRRGDVIRINELTLLLPLQTGAQWPAKDSMPVLQLISISISILRDVRSTANSDDLSHSIDYSNVTEQLQKHLSSVTSYRSLEVIALAAHECIIASCTKSIEELHIKVTQQKGPLHCLRTAIETTFISVDQGWEIGVVQHLIEELVCPVIIGVDSQERSEKQDVVVNVDIESPARDLDQVYWIDMQTLVRKLYEGIQTSNYLTLEALTSSIAQQTLSTCPAIGRTVTIRAAKPSALVLASSAEIVITRGLDDYPEFSGDHLHPQNPKMFESQGDTGLHTVAIALGSNLGDRFRNIEFALRLLEVPQQILGSEDELSDSQASPREATVVDTSFLYETAPMYVTDQPCFLNCACLIETNLSPLTILYLLKKIEALVGRVPTIRNGPRAVDLDLIFYDHAVYDTRPLLQRGNLDNLQNELLIPHPRLAEREFVLRPLHDIMPDFLHPSLGKTIGELLGELKLPPNEPPMERIVPFPSFPLADDNLSIHPSILPVPHTLTYWKYPSSFCDKRMSKFETRVMATLNTTPDSFSDGSTHNNMPTALVYTRESVEAGAAIIDIGGYSTRPSAAFVSVDDEMNRVVPVVKAIRGFGLQDPDPSDSFAQHVRQIPISIDTFRWEVAEASILAGANCINDVYAFTGPDSYMGDSEVKLWHTERIMKQMKRISRDYSTPVILMHSRGDAGQNKDYSQYEYAGENNSVLEGVRIELGGKVDQIVKGKGGVRRWMVIADPGIGFSKTLEGNLEVLRDAARVIADIRIGKDHRKRNSLAGYPQLLGVSRKSFLGAILSQGENGRTTTPRERVWATAAAVTCAVQQGALIVRVHDTKDMADVVQIADALWR